MRVSTLAKFRAGGILTFAFVVIVLSIIGLLILLWIELTNPELLESASEIFLQTVARPTFGCLLPVMLAVSPASMDGPMPAVTVVRSEADVSVS